MESEGIALCLYVISLRLESINLRLKFCIFLGDPGVHLVCFDLQFVT